jgi:Ca-activated chloride channel family protein
MSFTTRRRLATSWLVLVVAAMINLLSASGAQAQDNEVRAPAVAEPGAVIEVEWRGENAPGDFIAIAEPGSAPGKFIAYARTSRGNPAQLTLPGSGDYELRYIAAAGLQIMARSPLSVGVAAKAIQAPAEANAGAEITVTVSDPGDAADYVTIVEANAPALAFGPYARLRGASQATLAAPDVPGAYEIRHIHASNQSIIARAALTVRGAAAEETAPAGETAAAAKPASPPKPTLMALIAVDNSKPFHIAWTGPGGMGDLIGIAPSGGGATSLLASQPASGSILALAAPASPGDYDLVYVDGGGAVLTRREIEVW